MEDGSRGGGDYFVRRLRIKLPPVSLNTVRLYLCILLNC